MNIFEVDKGKLDEGQMRMNAAAEALFNSPEIHAKLHEYDETIQALKAAGAPIPLSIWNKDSNSVTESI